MACVSCIVPVFNCERYIERALRSVLEQSVPVDEVLIVDDGSTDDTPKLVERYAERATIIRQANAGPSAARNTGIRAATGDLICFQDADDEWLKDKLARQLDYLAAHPDVDGCITKIRNIWDESLQSERERLQGHRSTQDPLGYVFQTLLARREVFDTAGLLDESLRTAEDVEWYARTRDRGVRIGIVPEVLVYRYLHGANLSEQKGATASERHADLLEMMAARLKSRGTPEPEKEKRK